MSAPDGRPSDGELIHAVQAGDTGAFDELMKRYAASIYRLTYSLVRNHADADDMVQETFIRAFRAIRRFDERFQFYTWLRKIAVNLCFNHLKRARRVATQPLPLADGDSAAADIPDPRADAEGSSLRRDLDAALFKLPADQRTIFLLRVKEELSYNEIAETLGIPVGTVMSRLNRAREKLRVLLKDYLPAL